MAYDIHVEQDQFYLDKNKLKLDTQSRYTFLYIRAPECPGCKKFIPTFSKLVDSLSDLRHILSIKVHTLLAPSKLLNLSARSTTKITVVPYLILFKGHDILTIFDVPYETAQSLSSKIRELVETEQRDIYSRDGYHNPQSSFVYPPMSEKNTYSSYGAMDRNAYINEPPKPSKAPPLYSRGQSTLVGSGSHSRFDVQSTVSMNNTPNIQFADEQFLDEWSQFPIQKSGSLYRRR